MKRVVALTLALSGLLFIVGAPQATAQGADDPSQVAAGQTVFEITCAGCHGTDGSGVVGLGRSLTGIASQGERARHIESVTNGRGGMPAFGERLSAEEIEQAVSYVRLTFVAPVEATEDSAADAAADDTAAETTELALTGAASTGIAVLGLTMLAGGLHLVVWSRRRDLH